MEIEKMREEFESHYAEEFSILRGYKPSPEEMVFMRDGDGYGSDRGYLNGYWKGWQASRESIVVDLPFLFPYYRQEVIEALTTHGIRTK